MILTFPDGSAMDAQYVAAITWDKARADLPACVRIFGQSEDYSLGLIRQSPKMSQKHYFPMPSDEEAEKVCHELVAGWTGRALQPAIS